MTVEKIDVVLVRSWKVKTQTHTQMNVGATLKHIRGIPYYLDGTNLYSFEVHGGKPSPHSVLLGTYDPATDRVQLLDGWAEAAKPRLDAYREGVIARARDDFRQSIDKPEKQSASKRAPRTSSRRTKAPVCK